jgi:hypothetical protein
VLPQVRQGEVLHHGGSALLLHVQLPHTARPFETFLTTTNFGIVHLFRTEPSAGESRELGG